MSVTEEMIESLKPCPFCGMAVEVQTSKTLGDRLFVIACPEDSPCRGSGLGIYVIAGQVAEAIAAWNRRALEAALSAAPSAPQPTEPVAAGWQSALHGALISRIMPETKGMTDAEAQALGTDLLGLIRTYAPVATVKPLEWRQVGGPWNFLAESLGFAYRASQGFGDDTTWELRFFNTLVGTYPGEAEAKAAAQADYNARISAALASPVAQQRDELIEECAKIAEEFVQTERYCGPDANERIAARIRALSPERKDQSNG